MKYVLSLALVAAAAVGATRDYTTARAGAPRTDEVLRAKRQATVPWLRDAWSSSVELASMDVDGADPHAGLYAADSEDPHAGLYAAEDGSGMCPRLDGDLTEQPDGAEVITAESDPHAAAVGRAALLQAGLEPRVVVPSNAANGRTIAQLYAQRAALAEQVVRVRGTVIKRTDGILGKTYLHLWDGSAARENGEDDLTVTTTTDGFEIGETVELEGRLLIDLDLGLGYRYSALLDGAERIAVTQ